MKKALTLTFALLGLAIMTMAQTNISGLINSNQTWNPSGSPYLLTGSVVIDSGVTLTIQPGTIIKSVGHRVYANGSIEANGTSTSKIQIDSVQFIFSAKSTDYDPITKKGCQFDFCVFTGRNERFWYNLQSKFTDLIITNSKFYNGSVDFSAQYHTDIIIDNCLFDNSNLQNKKLGTPINSSNRCNLTITNSEFIFFNFTSISETATCKKNIFKNFNTINAAGIFENNTFDSFSTISSSGHFDYIRNTFSNFSKLTFEAPDTCNIKCNTFMNGQFGLELTQAYYRPSSRFVFENNTLDSMGGTNAMLTYYNNYGYRDIPNIAINYNNFLTRTGTTEKIIFSQPLKTSPTLYINTESNYWGTTDSAIIESYIEDYADNSTNYFRADISNFATSQITPDCDIQKACNAKFSITVDTGGTATFVDSSTAANAYTRTWLYGDGSNGGHSFKKHLYNPGSYNACLAIVDNVTGCKDTFCTSITIKGKSSCEASYYFGIDTSNKFNIFLIDDSKGVTSTTQFLWDFGDGNTSTLRKPKHTYKQFKKYVICLTLKDSAKNCFSTYCDSVGMDSLGNIRRSAGFSINVIYDWELTSIKEDEKITIQIFPNPTTGKAYFNIEKGFKNGATIKVMNQVGKVVLSQSDNNNGFVDLMDLSNGMYFIHLYYANKYGVAKVMLNK